MIINAILVLVFFTRAGRGASGVSLSLPSATAVGVVVAIATVIFGAAYIGPSVLRSASSTAGGVGGVEAALIAGLTGSASACRKPDRRCWSAGSSPLGS